MLKQITLSILGVLSILSIANADPLCVSGLSWDCDITTGTGGGASGGFIYGGGARYGNGTLKCATEVPAENQNGGPIKWTTKEIVIPIQVALVHGGFQTGFEICGASQYQQDGFGICGDPNKIFASDKSLKVTLSTGAIVGATVLNMSREFMAGVSASRSGFGLSMTSARNNCSGLTYKAGAYVMVAWPANKATSARPVEVEVPAPAEEKQPDVVPTPEEKPAPEVKQPDVVPAPEEKPAPEVKQPDVVPAPEEKPAPEVKQPDVVPAPEEKPAPEVKQPDVKKEDCKEGGDRA